MRRAVTDGATGRAREKVSEGAGAVANGGAKRVDLMMKRVNNLILPAARRFAGERIVQVLYTIPRATTFRIRRATSTSRRIADRDTRAGAGETRSSDAVRSRDGAERRAIR